MVRPVFAGLAVLVGLPSFLGVGVLRAEPLTPSTTANGEALSPDAVGTSKAAAEERFQRGLALANARSWDAALAEFIASRELYPTRSATRNAAIVLQKLRRYVESCETYEALLQQFADSMPAALVIQVRDELKGACAQTGQLTISTSETGVVVVVNGKQRGVTPLAKPIGVDPGTHTVRLAKPGFETRDLVLSLAGGTIKQVDVDLKRLADSGGLLVREAGGRALEILVDAGVVGATPWRGKLAPGVHAIQLRGVDSIGTAPTAVTLKAGQTLELVLRAVPLEAWAHIEPAPNHANVFVDGVPVGTGPWEGRLSRGVHRFEATAPGYLPFRADQRLERGQRQLVVAAMERDSLDSPRRVSRRVPMYAELAAGLFLARSFESDADSACQCIDRRRPFGATGTARVGVTFWPGLSLEAAGGYLFVTEELTRRMMAAGEGAVPRWTSSDYADTTQLSGPTIAAGVAYRSAHLFPITARTSVGLAFLRAVTTNFGNFQAQAMDAEHALEQVQRPASIAEADHSLLTPFAEVELKVGRRFGSRLSVDLGVGLRAFFPPRERRARATGGNERFGVLGNGTWSNGDTLRPGLLTLPSELVARSFLAVTPNLGARFSF